MVSRESPCAARREITRSNPRHESFDRGHCRSLNLPELQKTLWSKINKDEILAENRSELLSRFEHGRDRSHLGMPSLSSWSPPDVWLTLRGIIVDQLEVHEEDMKEEAAFLRDLGCD